MLWYNTFMEKESIKNRVILPIIDFLVVAFLIGSMSYFIVSVRATDLSYPISDNWDVAFIDDAGYRRLGSVNLDEFNFTRDYGRVKSMSLSRRFGGDELEYSTLRVYLMAADVRVFLDGNVIYSSMDEDGRLNDGRGYAFVDIPYRSSGGAITVSVTARDEMGLLAIPEIALTPSAKSYAFYVHENWPGILVSIFILMFGIVVSVLSAVFRRLNTDYARVYEVGMFSIFGGIWLLSSLNVPLLFGMDPAKNSTIGYIAVSVVFLPLLSLDIRTRSAFSARDEGIIKKVIYINMIVAVILAILHFSGILSYVSSVPVLHLMYVVNCILILTVGVGRFSDMKLDERIYHVDFVFMILAGFVYMAIYYLRTFFRIVPMEYTETWFPAATFVFVVVQLIAYLVHIYGMLLNRAEEEALEHLAYNDALTGLYNRARAEDDFKALDEGDAPYAFINIDLNGLKTINDERGHAQGDVFIASFANILREVFGGACSCVRMGGDEFLVIVGADKMDETDDLIIRMEDFEKQVSKDLSFEVDAAYGVAKSTEMEHPVAEQIFRLADERMYEMKKATKKGRLA